MGSEAVTEPLYDVAGQRIEVGDYVVYPQLSGRCVQMVLGRCTELGASSARVERVDGGRWKAGWKRTRYRDTRSGKSIDPGRSDRHWLIPNRVEVRHKDTGEVIDNNLYDGMAWYDKAKYRVTYVRGTLRDYVEEYQEGPGPVTIHILENLVKVPTPPHNSGSPEPKIGSEDASTVE